MRNWQPLFTYHSYSSLRQTGRFNASPPLILAGGFIVVILLGTGLFMLPASTREPMGFFTALFTATSAVTVTGMQIVDPGASLTLFGEIVLAALIQVGGLGFVTFAVVAALSLGKKIGLRQQAVVLEAFNQTSVARIRRTAFAVLRLTILIELGGIAILTLWWLPGKDWLQVLGSASFHVISAFNNAGVSQAESSLYPYVGDPVTILTLSALIILGGIGFNVLSDIGVRRRWSRLQPYTRMVIVASLALNLAGFAMIWALEYDNPLTLGDLSLGGQALAAWFQSVVTRTAGFQTIDVAQLRDSTSLIMMLLMFIGGGSLSTASGIKVGTFVVLLAAAYAYIFGRREVVLFQRAIPPDAVQKALALLLVTLALTVAGIFCLCVLEDFPFLDLVFETVAAISTTGMDRGLTPKLSPASQSILMVLMIVGRLGPLTLVYSLATRTRSRIRYPETEMQIG